MKTFQSQTEVKVEFNCDPMHLNINQAIPCSLIVNEVITNIFKHAFPGKDKGKIGIILFESSKTNTITLSIKDDGAGLPKHFDITDPGSLGMNLIDVLSQQLNADYLYNSSGQGTFDLKEMS